MLAEINLLDWMFAVGQGLCVASFFYFLYLVARYSRFATIVGRGLSGNLQSGHPGLHRSFNALHLVVTKRPVRG